MRVYLHSEQAEKSDRYMVTVCPAGDTQFVKSADVLDAWKHPSGEPKQIEVIFQYGKADVDDALGRYMVARGIAFRSRFIRAIKHGLGMLFGADGKPLDAYDKGGRPVILGGVQVEEAV